MAPRRQCPIDYALEVFGDRWSLIVLRDILLAGKRHYRELVAAKEGIATNVLASRLKKLEAAGLLRRRADPSDKRVVFYVATAKALDLIPVLLEISRWSVKYDLNSAAPPELVKRYDDDREQLIADLQQAARARQE
ncbi:MAG TPA: helix-turn-helix domain-containing protein [Polyangiaceae bacterium]|jgi:DNA-binding HxlR family transcriptional regulator|nr:helix-turn-helix domain-containing protein [Polyangiaceae bacterium]